MFLDITINENVSPISSDWYVSHTMETILYYPAGRDHAVIFDSVDGDCCCGYIGDETLRNEYFPIDASKVDFKLVVNV